MSEVLLHSGDSLGYLNQTQKDQIYRQFHFTTGDLENARQIFQEKGFFETYSDYVDSAWKATLVFFAHLTIIGGIAMAAYVSHQQTKENEQRRILANPADYVSYPLEVARCMDPQEFRIDAWKDTLHDITANVPQEKRSAVVTLATIYALGVRNLLGHHYSSDLLDAAEMIQDEFQLERPIIALERNREESAYVRREELRPVRKQQERPARRECREQFRVLKDFLLSHQFAERSQVIHLAREIAENTGRITRGCLEDTDLTDEIFAAATKEFESLLELSRALTFPDLPIPIRERGREVILEQEQVQSILSFLGRSALTEREMAAFRDLIKDINPNMTLRGQAIGGTMLHRLAKVGRAIPLVQVLKDAGIDFNILDHWGNTALIWAIANGNFSMAREMIRLAPMSTDFNIKGRGNTALHLAIGKGYTTRTRDGDPLTVSSLDLARELVGKTDPNNRGRAGNTPLHIACVRRDQEMIQLLMENGANPSLRNDQGERAIDLLSKTYEEASAFLNDQTSVFLLDRSRFEASYEACRALF
jgi:hypothetical protein